MRRLLFAALAVLVAAWLPIAAGAGQQVPLINDNINGQALGREFTIHKAGTTVYADPVIQTTWYGVCGAGLGGNTYYARVIDSAGGVDGRCIDLYESNTAGSGNGAALYLYHLCKKVNMETCWFQADVMMPQNTAGFTVKVSFTQGKYPAGTGSTGAQANNGAAWAGAICFEGNQPWANGASSSPGRISYQTLQTNQYWVDTGMTYTAGNWYTVRFEMDVAAKKYQVLFGPRGTAYGDLVNLTGGYIDFIRRTNSTGAQVPAVNSITFDSSEKLGGNPAEAAGHMYIDNVTSIGSQDMKAPLSIAELKTYTTGFPGQGSGGTTDPPEPGTYIQCWKTGGANEKFRVASVGTDELGGFFYLVDGDRTTGRTNPEGIRVRMDPLQVNRQPSDYNQGNRVWPGDIVDISGYVQKASDNGMMVRTDGEKEILAITLDADSPGYFAKPFSVPQPYAFTNREIGGGDMFYEGLDEVYAGDPFLPGVFKAANDTPPPAYFKQPGLNNVGNYGKFWGKVTFSAPDPGEGYYPYFYIDDGSAVTDGSNAEQTGVRVMLKKTRVGAASALSNLADKYIMVTGVVGAISSSDLVPSTGTNNVRLIRAYEEPFSDANNNGLYDVGEVYDDLNRNGVYDGIIVLQ